MKRLRSNLFPIAGLLLTIWADIVLTTADFGELFDAMAEAYFVKDWALCIESGENALKTYEAYQESVAACRVQCRSTTSTTSLQDEFLALYSASLYHVTCVQACKREANGGLTVSQEVVDKFEQREPYDYLQVCYYKVGNHGKAASAAVTFLAKNPEHEYMNRNVIKYRDVVKVPAEHFVDMETSPLQVSYKQGREAYLREDYSESLKFMRLALNSYFQEYEKCSTNCESGHEVKNEDYRNHEAVGPIAEQIVAVVGCKAACTEKLSRLDVNRSENDILLSIYHHLQFLLYAANDLAGCCSYTAAFLMYRPQNTTLLQNKKVLEEAGAQQDWFKAPEIDIQHKARLDELERLQSYIKTEYISQHSLDSSRSVQTRALREFNGGSITVNASGSELGGPQRFVADGFATVDECKHLIHLCKGHCTPGDGYKNKQRPLSPHETFHGLTIQTTLQSRGIGGYHQDGNTHSFTIHEAVYGLNVSTAISLVKDGTLSSSLLHLYLKLSDSALEYVKLYFNLDHLYFSYTHLVCRAAVDSAVERHDLSHFVHADNCVVKPNGDCHKDPSAYTERDYSAIFYLNGDFDGGEFFFTDRTFAEQAYVQPSCGRLVGFDSGIYHGVKAVKSGRRCALAMWFTLDASYDETARREAQEFLNLMHGYSVISDSNGHDEL